jgi:Na+-transporting NADH:ubiquinone oxidoreductase subunit C
LPDLLRVFMVTMPGKECVVLPIHGYGLWTTLYGFIALKMDASEVVGITYYEHGETPGLGGEVDNPSWKAQFPGKEPLGDDGEVVLRVKKAGQAARGSDHEIDGLSGATITTVGVDRMLQLWLGEHGYGKFLEQLASGKS